MIKVDVSDNEVRVTIGGETLVSHFEDVIKLFKGAKTDLERRCLAVKLTVDSICFEKVSEEKPVITKKPSTLDILEGCARLARKTYDYEIEDEIDDLLGSDPYTPLY